MEELNPAQREAATHDGGPVLVVAGAGTGKTRTLASRVAWLIEQGTSPDRILLLTFTRRAATELLRRAARVSGQATTRGVWSGTFHSIANRLLRQYGRNIGIDTGFTVMDQGDAADLMNLIRGELEFDKSKRRFPKKKTLIDIYSHAVNARTKLPDVLEVHFPWCQDDIDGIRDIFKLYTRRKRDQNVLDYDDLLLHWKLLCESDGIADTVANRFEHVLVDEYQDTNLVQAEILQGMRRQHRNIMVVGDDAQSIYSFRAATIRNILDFPLQFPGTRVIKLEQNYRSIQAILDASNAVMSEAKQRYTKNLFTERGQGQEPTIVTCLDEGEQCTEVCNRILEKHEEGVSLHEQAVLFRAGHHSDQLEIELNRRNIPFVKYGGLKFLEAAHVKDMIAFLRILENPRDELSWYRVLQLLDGIGPATARRIIESLNVSDCALQREQGTAITSPLHTLINLPPAVPVAAREQFARMRKAVADCLADGPGKQGLSPASQVERIRRFYEPVFESAYDNPTIRLRDLEQLEQIAGRYRSRAQFITDLALDPPSSTQDLAGPPLLDEDYLILSTIHSAKGLEWDAVHIIHAADGMIPSDMATGSDDEIEEERRLLYVAMTRAQNTLTIYFPLRYYQPRRRFSDRHSFAQLTRFIPESSLHLFERTSTRHVELAEEPAATRQGSLARQSVESMLEDLWGEQ